MNRRTASGAAMIVGTSVTIQISGALAHGLFDQLGATGVSAMRFALASAFLLVGVRPSLRGRDRRTWQAILLYGVSLAALNIGFFQAIDRIPMGIAVTLAFAGPVVMSIAASRRASDVALALLAGFGVAVLGGLDRPQSIVGVAFGLATGAAWVGVAYAGRSIGRRTERIDGLALAVPVAALITVPLGARHLGAVDAHALGIGVVIAVVGLILPFALEIEGLRRLEPRIVAILYSVDPAVAAMIGLLALGQRLTAWQFVAMGAVMIASVAGVQRGQAPLAGPGKRRGLVRLQRSTSGEDDGGGGATGRRSARPDDPPSAADAGRDGRSVRSTHDVDVGR